MSETSFNTGHQVGVEEGEGGEKIMVKLTKSGNLVSTRMDVAGFRKYCQADDCSTDLNNAKEYYKRHKVCELHAKASVVMVKSLPQRFCQQCSKFHDLAKFDYVKRSCRDRLAYHNERRRKSVQGKDPVGGPSSPKPQVVSTNVRGLMTKRYLNLNETAIQSSASSSSLSTIAGNHHHHHHHHHHPNPNTPNLLEMALHNAPSYQAYAKAMMMANQQRTFF